MIVDMTPHYDSFRSYSDHNGVFAGVMVHDTQDMIEVDELRRVYPGPDKQDVVAIDDLTTTKHRLEAEADKLLEARFADAIDLPTLKRHQDRIRIALADVTKRLEAERHDHEGPRQRLATALRLLADCAKMYERTEDLGKRFANQAFYQRILITEEEKAAIQLNEPFAALAPASSDIRCLVRLIWWT